MPTSVCPLGRLEPPLTARRQRKGMQMQPLGPHGQLPRGGKMLLPPVGAGRELLLPGRLWLPSGQGDPGHGGGVDVGGANVLTRRHGDNQVAPGPAPTPPTRACLAVISGTSFRSFGLLGSVSSGPRLGPAPGSCGPLAALTGNLHTMMRAELLAPMVAHLQGPRVEWHLETKAKYWE